jgi:hypothetical protein
LGVGGFGAVFAGRYLDTQVAVKIIKPDPAQEIAFKDEVEKLMYVWAFFIFFFFFVCQQN